MKATSIEVVFFIQISKAVLTFLILQLSVSIEAKNPEKLLGSHHFGIYQKQLLMMEHNRGNVTQQIA